MTELIELIPGGSWTGAWVLARITGVVFVLPTLVGRSFGWVHRAILSVALTILITPICAAHLDPVARAAACIPMMLHELAVGMALGLGVHLLLLGVQTGGQLVSQMAGISLAGVYGGESSTSVSPLTRFTDLLALALFLTVGGHRLVIGTLLGTFVDFPPGTAALCSSSWEIASELLTQSLLLGLQAVLPLLLTLLVSNLLAGVLGRLMPQLNVLVMSSGLNVLLAMAAMLIATGSVAWALDGHLEPFLGHAARLCGG